MSESLREPEEQSIRPEKAPEAFRTISEVAESLDIPQHVLRFWETRFSQIRPMKRGGGRRYYRPADVDLLKGIRHLLYSQGFTIRGVQRILKENGTAHVVAVGREAAKAAEQAAADEQKPVTVQSRKPRIIIGGERNKLHPGSSGEVIPRPAMTREQVTDLREALADLLWARRILSGSGKTH
jgi:DNA-binding transcriptional MerR regulator